MILVTGCARSGTLYTHEVLKHFGKCMPHEGIGKDGSVSWHLAPLREGPAPASLRNYYDIERVPYFEQVWHQIRHPLRAVGSWGTCHPNSRDFASKFIGHVPEDPLIGGMYYWLGGNEAVEDRANWTYRIEYVDLKLMCEKSGGTWSDGALAVKKDVNTRSNQYLKVTWRRMLEADRDLAKRVRDKSEMYGYPTTSWIE